MGEPVLSIVIPYKQRLQNLRVAFASLADQTMARSRFEVVVGAMEYSSAYVELCQEFAHRLNIVSVLTDQEWSRSRARNLGLRQVSGEVTMFLDADMALPTRCLQSLYDRYFGRGQEVCVLGQLIGYDFLAHTPLGSHAVPSYDQYQALLAELEAKTGVCEDDRWKFDPIVPPWTMVWTGLVALPTATIRRHGLLFDENFLGWGGEDQEWGYRIDATGTPIVRGADIYGLHLPHYRDVPANLEVFADNKRYFLSKWPALDVELYRAFNSWEANRRIAGLRREVAAVAADGGNLGVARGTIDGADTLVVGTVLDPQAQIRDATLRAQFGNGSGSAARVLPLLGIALPFPNHSVETCRVLPPILALSEQYRTMVLREAARVSRHVVLPGLAADVRSA
jgi:glycosyltransferase involved in cell wall biosynthesis